MSNRASTIAGLVLAAWLITSGPVTAQSGPRKLLDVQADTASAPGSSGKKLPEGHCIGQTGNILASYRIRERDYPEAYAAAVKTGPPKYHCDPRGDTAARLWNILGRLRDKASRRK